jgi:hypothetical protein
LAFLKRRTDALTQEWASFLQHLEARCELSKAHAEIVRNYWHRLSRGQPSLPLPIAHKTSEGELQLAWSYTSLLLEIDISSPGEIYWFGKDRDSGDCEDGVLDASSELSRNLRTWLEKIASA